MTGPTPSKPSTVRAGSGELESPVIDIRGSRGVLALLVLGVLRALGPSGATSNARRALDEHRRAEELVLRLEAALSTDDSARRFPRAG